MLYYGKFQKSLKRLQEQYSNYLELDQNYPEFILEAMSESVVQRFEKCYDALWKTLRRYLREELGVVGAPNSPKPIFRVADENGLLESSVEIWFKYARARIEKSHDYDGEKATACLDLVPDFIEDAIALYHTMNDKE